MTAPGIDEQQHRDALVALLSTALHGHLYDAGDVPGAAGVDGTLNPGDLPDVYTVLAIERDPVLIDHTHGRASRSAWAVTFTTTARYVSNVRKVQTAIASTLEGVRLTVGAEESTPVTFENSKATKPDQGRFVGVRVAAYVL